MPSPLALIGGAFVLYHLYLFTFWLYNTFIYKANLKKYNRNGSSWAIVTGCTDGIGKGFVTELAKEKFNIILVSRTESKLKELEAEIKNTYNVSAKYVVVDASINDSAGVEKIIAATNGLNVTMLVNNVGVSAEIPTAFEDLTKQEIENMINVNITFATRLTHALLPSLKQNKPAAIVNLGSHVGAVHVPMQSIYSGSKAFIMSWSTALRVELKKDKVDVFCVAPGWVATQLAKIKRTSFTVCSPRQCARATLNAIGSRTISCGYWVHDVQLFVYLKVLPRFYLDNQLMAIGANARKKWAARQAAAKSQ